MRKSRVFLFVIAILAGGTVLISSALSRENSANSFTRQDLMSQVHRLQIPFVANEGQTDAQVRFYAKTFGGSIFVQKDGSIIYSLPGSGGKETGAGIVLKEEFVGAGPPSIRGEEQTSTRVNYIKGNDRSKWKSGIPAYQFVNLGQAYPGIELKIRAYGNNAEKLFFVSPGGKPEVIRARLTGGSSLRVTSEGELELGAEKGYVRFSKPVAYQCDNEGNRKYVEVAYLVEGNEYGFKTGEYDANLELVIDPLLASTYMGGSGDEAVQSIALDASGNVYVAGYTYSADFPVTVGAYSTELHGAIDAFVAKLSGDLTTLYASTFLGGANSDWAQTLAYADGSVYVAGYTNSPDFPTSLSAYKRTCGSDGNCDCDGGYCHRDGFLSKLDADLGALQASTYLGGRSDEGITAMAVDSVGASVYVCGYTYSSDFPKTYLYGAGGSKAAFISKLDLGLTTAVSALIGGSKDNSGNALTLGDADSLYLVGSTNSADFPATGGAYKTTYSGQTDVFVVKMQRSLASLDAASFLGGAAFEEPSSALFRGGSLYVTGTTLSPDFPTTSGAYSTVLQGVSDVFVSKLSGDLTSLEASSFLGGNDVDAARSMGIGADGSVYLSGLTYSANFPVTAGAFSTSFSGTPGNTCDAFLSKFDNALTTLQVSTFLGGSDNDSVRAMVLDSNSRVFLAGVTRSWDFPTTSDALQPAKYYPGDDAFISVMSMSGPAGSPWPMFHHDALHTGRSPYLGAQTGDLRWTFTTGDIVTSSPAIDVDGIIYVGSMDGNLYAVKPDGTEKWRTGGTDGILASPAIGVDGTIYFGNINHALIAVDQATGAEKWRYLAEGTFESSPAIGPDGTIYAGSFDSFLYAVNPDGGLRWKFETGNVIESSPAVGADGTVYIGSWDHNVYAVNPADGTEKWRFVTGAMVTSSPTIGSDGVVYAGSSDNNLYAINPNGSEKWRFTSGGAFLSSPAIGPDMTIYAGSADFSLYAIDPATGVAKWSFASGDTIVSSPAIGLDGTVYFGGYDQKIYALDPTNGAVKWSLATGDVVGSSPAIGSNGTVYVGSGDKKLYAVGGALLEPSISVAPTWMDFGNVPVGGASSPQDVTIFNAGSASLHINAISLPGGTAAPNFVVDVGGGPSGCGSPPITLVPGSYCTVSVTFTPSAEGLFYNSLMISSDDPAAPDVYVDLVGTGTGGHQPVIWVDPPAFTFGDTNVGESSAPLDVTIYNTGSADLILSNASLSDPADFSLNLSGGPSGCGSLPGTIIPGGQCTVSVVFNPQAEGSITGVLTILSSDPVTPSATVALAGTGVVQTGPSIGYSPSSFRFLAALGGLTPSAQTLSIWNADGGTLVWQAASSAEWLRLDPLSGIESGSVQVSVDTTGLGVGTYEATITVTPSDGTTGVSGKGAGSPVTIPVVLILYPSGGPANTAWPIFRHDLSHTGRSPFTGSPGPDLKWSFATEGVVNSSPAIGADGTIYVGSWDGKLYAVNADGSLKWSFATEGYEGYIESSPGVGLDGTIYVGSWDGNLYALNPADGSEKWRFETGAAILSSVAIGYDGAVYFGSCDNSVYAVNPDGTLKWNLLTGDDVDSTPAIGPDGMVYAGSQDGMVYAISPEGYLIWTSPTGDSIASSPAVGGDGTIYIGSEDAKLYAMRPADGEVKWAFPSESLTGAFESSPAIGVDGTVYAASLDGNLYALNPAEGYEIWRFSTGSPIKASPAVGADGLIYIGSENGGLYAINPAGEVVWRFDAGDGINSSPALGNDGTIYFGSLDTSLYAISGLSPCVLNISKSGTGSGGVLSNPAGIDCGTSCQARFLCASTVELTATASSNSTFDHWEGDLTGSENPASLRMDGPKSVTAVFTATTVTLTTSVSPSGAGSVELTPPGGVYNTGQTVNVKATANSGFVFDHWEGDLSGNVNPVDVVMNAPKSIKAVFTVPYTLTTAVSPAGTGAITLTPPGPGYRPGEVVQLTAVPATGYIFDHWEGAVSGTDNPASLTMNANSSVTAFFVRQDFKLTLAVTPVAGGVIDRDPDPKPNGKYGAGTAVTLTAEPRLGHAFDHWEGDLTGSTNPAVVTMNGDKSVTAVFVAASFTLTTTSTPPDEGAIEVTPAAPGGVYPAQTSLSLKAVPVEGFSFAHWEGDLGGSANPAKNFTMNSNKTVNAVFMPTSEGSVTIELPAAPRDNLTKGYRMIGIPLKSPNRLTRDVFTTVAGFFGGSANPSSWALYKSDGETAILRAGVDTVEYGKGWWLVSKVAKSMSITGIPLTTDFPQNVLGGYQMIACPYIDRTIAWADVAADPANAGLNLGSALYYYDGSGEYVTSTSMTPGGAYWVWVGGASGGVLQIRRDYGTALRVRSSAASDLLARQAVAVNQPPPPLAPLANIKAVFPKSNSRLKQGGAYDIQWSSSGLHPQGFASKVDIQLTTDGGKNWTTIAAGVENSGAYRWNVSADKASRSCFLKITSPLYPQLTGAKTKKFAIVK